MSNALWISLPVAAAVLLLVMLWSARRHRSPTLQVACDAPIESLLPSLAGLTQSTVLAGNAVRLHANGAFYDVLLARMAAARRSLHFETFLWKHGVLGQRMADCLCERAQAGVQVRIVLDATGARRIGKPVQEQLRQAGCQLVFFHKRSLRNLGVLNDRDHRKLVVIDGREAFVGGHCITDDWLGDAEDGRHFADLSVQLHGPIVHSVQAAFLENWCAETGQLLVGDDVFPPLAPAGDIPIHAAFVKPERSAPAVKMLHHAALCLARRRLWIQNPYFIPEPEAVEAFGAAVKRGVDVRVLMPSTSGSDNPIVQHAGHRNFERLLVLGVRLFEYPHTLLHQKVMTIDGAWCAIGSSNFDDRSFDTNDEITLGILDAALAAELDSIFERYATRAQEIRLEAWRHRGAWHRLKDNVCYLGNELL